MERPRLRAPATRTSSTRSPPCSRATGTAATSSPTTARSSLDASERLDGCRARTSSSARSSCGPSRSRSDCSSRSRCRDERGHHRNLLVSATGTGKTVMAAVDYARLRASAAAGAAAVRRPPRGDPRAEPGDLPPRAARSRPSASSGSAAAARAGSSTCSRRSRASTPPASAHLDADHFDVVIVDEFHHAAAPSYRALLEHVHAGRAPRPDRHARAQRRASPARLVRRTASPPSSGCGTPSISTASCPFAYYGIHDGLDLREMPWRRGRGYDVEGLTKLFTANDVWARRVVVAARRPRRRLRDGCARSGSA